MKKLVKPVDYAREAGISRQAVYMKIKKGTLPSRTVDGKIYVIVESDRDSDDIGSSEGETERKSMHVPDKVSSQSRVDDLLKAKDETISVLRETVKDLKETNKMITTTLRSEVELLKEAFSEMKTLYAAQIEHIRETDTIDTEADRIEALPEHSEIDSEKDTEDADIGEWITLGEFGGIYGMKKKRLKNLKKKLKKLYKKGDGSVKIVDGEYFISDISVVKALMKDG